jgi:hypothetical protein
MRFTLLRRKLSVSAPKMAIKAHVPWPLRLLSMAVVVGLAAVVAMWTYDLGSRFAGFNKDELKAELTRLRGQVTELTDERDALLKTANAAESKLAMEKAAQQQLSSQVKTLEDENSRLKEENGFFESLLPTNGQDGAVAIRNLRAQMDVTPNTLRYRLLLMQGGKPDRDFSGNLQMIVVGTVAGRNVTLNFPETTATTPDTRRFEVSFRRYQRFEGTLNLPEGCVVKSLQVRVMQQGNVRAQQAAAVG